VRNNCVQEIKWCHFRPAGVLDHVDRILNRLLKRRGRLCVRFFIRWGNVCLRNLMLKVAPECRFVNFAGPKTFLNIRCIHEVQK